MRNTLLCKASLGLIATMSVAAGQALAAEAKPLTASATLSVTADDNILASRAGQISDAIWEFDGSAKLTGEGEAGSIDLYGDVSLQRYADTSDENADDFTVGLDAKLRFDGANLTAGVSHALNTEDRKDRNARRDTRERTEFNLDTVYASGVLKLDGVKLSAKVSSATRDFDNGRSRTTGAVILQDDRDRTTLDQSLRADFNVDQAVAVFFKAEATQLDYDLVPPASRHARSSEGFTLSTGVTFNEIPSLTGDIQGGWTRRTYDDAALKDVNDFTVSADVTWTPTAGDSLEFSVSRQLEETVLRDSPGYVASTVSLTLNHKVSDLWSVNLSASREMDDHKQIDRTDNITTLAAGASVNLPGNAQANLSYTWSQEDSSGMRQGPGYDSGVITASLSTSF